MDKGMDKGKMGMDPWSMAKGKGMDPWSMAKGMGKDWAPPPAAGAWGSPDYKPGHYGPVCTAPQIGLSKASKIINNVFFLFALLFCFCFGGFWKIVVLPGSSQVAPGMILV